MIKAIIFDFDGVILQSANIKTDAFAEVVKDYPKEQAEAFVEYHKSHMGISRYVKFQYFVEKILNQAYTKEMEQHFGDLFTKITFEKIMSCPFVSGAKEFLECQYQTRDFYLASGTPKSELEVIVSGRNLSPYFKGVYGTPEKKEEIIEHILSQFQYQTEEVLFVGDAMTDKNAAKAKNLTFIGVQTKENQADFQDVIWKINSLMEINHILDLLEERK